MAKVKKINIEEDDDIEPQNDDMGPMQIAKKPKDFKKSFVQMAVYGKRYLKWVVIAMVLALVGTILSLIGPNLIGNITDSIFDAIDKTTYTVAQINMHTIWKYVAILVCIYVIGGLLSYAQSFIMATVTQRYTLHMRKDISRKINKVPLKYFDSTTYGEILSRVTNDADTVGDNMNMSIGSLVTNVSMLLGSLLMMFIKSWLLTLAVIGTTILGFGIMMLIMAKSQKYFVSQQKFLGRLNGHIEEVYSGQQVINVYNAQQECKQKFDNYNEKLYRSAWKSQFLSGLMQPIMAFIGNLGYTVVCVLGAVLILKGKMTFGAITAFMIYIRLFINPLSQIAQSFTSVQTMVASGERVFEFLNEKEMDNEGHKTMKLTNIKGDVEFDNVKFSYNEDKEIIHDFSLKVKAGQKVAIVGKTGAGKTTLVNLLMRFYEINSGAIKIDGINIQDLTRENVHDMFSMVLQDSWLFNASVKDNIVYNKKDVGLDTIIDACKACGIDNFIKALPNGYDTILDDNTAISAGQKQLITIARAMVQNNPMLILDEATSSVDTRTEVLIQRAMDKLMHGRTSFVIAHRLSTIKNADIILVLEDGDIVEIGNHETLLQKNGAYAKLYNSQFEEV